jgi:hypothetical protein
VYAALSQSRWHVAASVQNGTPPPLTPQLPVPKGHGGWGNAVKSRRKGSLHDGPIFAQSSWHEVSMAGGGETRQFSLH